MKKIRKKRKNQKPIIIIIKVALMENQVQKVNLKKVKMMKKVKKKMMKMKKVVILKKQKKIN